MSKFCPYCGRPLEDGKPCTCPESLAAESKSSKGKWKSFCKWFHKVIISTKNHMGIGDPLRNAEIPYEADREQIIPDIVAPCCNEIPVKQYTLATLYRRFLGIPLAKAIARLQITNKRVILRVPGREFLRGRTMQQSEFDINKIHGMEIRRRNYFSFWRLLIAALISAFGIGIIMIALTTLNSVIVKDVLETGNWTNDIKPASVSIWVLLLSFLIGATGILPFAILRKHWKLKILCLACSVGAFMTPYSASLSAYYEFYGKVEWNAYGFFTFLGVLAAICLVFAIFVYSIKERLMILIQTITSTNCITLRVPVMGYVEIGPSDEAELFTREATAIIQDMQNVGDEAIEKWRNPAE